MNRRFPRHYTILISCTGREPIVLAFRPLVAFLSLSVSVGLPLILISAIVYSYAHKNTQLTQRNSRLTEEATQILQRLETLETRVQTLREQADLLDQSSETPNSEDTEEDTEELDAEEVDEPQGGVSMAVEAELLLREAKAQLPELLQTLQGEVEPAMKQTIGQVEARPKGIPLQTKADVSSLFGLRQNPFGWGYEFHQGLDFAAAYGTPVHATASGVVEVADWDAGFGNHVVIDHGYGYDSLYAHLSNLKVLQGMRVSRYQVIGYLGNTGRSSGPHLHYGIYHNGSAVDPKDYID